MMLVSLFVFGVEGGTVGMAESEERRVEIQTVPVATINILPEEGPLERHGTDRQEKKKLEDLNDEFMERMKRIMLEACPPLPRERKTSEDAEETELRLSPSLAALVGKRTVCTDEECNDEYCECCMGRGTDGKWGHFPWDELEMMKHGWMDQHGRHWGKNEPKDDLELLKMGALDREGHQINQELSTAGQILGRKMSVDDVRQLMSAKVNFGGVNVTQIPISEEEEEEEGGTALKPVPSQTTITLLDFERKEAPEISFDCYKVRGGEVTRVETERKRATLLKCPDRLIYVERGGEEDLLVAAHINSITGRFSTKRLQLNPLTSP